MTFPRHPTAQDSRGIFFNVRHHSAPDFALLKDEDLPKLERTVILDRSGSPDEGWEAFLELGAGTSLAEIDPLIAKVDGDDVADILFTSGTTGKPKGALSTHAQTVVTSRSWVKSVGLKADDK